jgi:HME family heavy-metal exporter
MLNAVIRFALRNRPLIVLLCLAVLGYGSYVAATLPIDVFPDLDRPRVVIMTECPAMAPADVETLVTQPLEAAILGATGVQAVRSQSGPGLSVVNVEFDWGTNIHVARQTVQERLASVTGTLPEGIKPQMAPISSIMGQILIVGLTRRSQASDSDLMALRTTADWVVRPRLLKIPGVAQVVVMGGLRKQYQVQVDPNALLEYDVTLQQVEDALRRNNLNASGGYAIQGEEEKPIRIIGRLGPEPARVLEDLRNVPVKPTPQRTIQLGHVARVVEGPQLKRGDASVDGHPAVVLTITKQPHVDTRAITTQIQTALRELELSLPADMAVTSDLFQMNRFIDTGVANVGEAMGIGALLVLIVLFLFLLNFRTTFISLTAIPLSLAITAVAFKLIGWLTGSQLSINVMTLGGIAVALGELVDDAIVDVENIFRRLRQNNASPNPRPALQVIYEASVEVRSAIVFGTILVILVFVPLCALTGIEGRLFTPLAVAYIVSILASLLVSLTVTPVLSSFLLPQARATHRQQDGFLLRGFKWCAAGLIRFSMARIGVILAVSLLLFGGAVWALTRLGADFLPEFDEGSVQVNVSLPPGSSLDASNRVAALVDAKLRPLLQSGENPTGELLHFVRRTGRAELDEHVEPVSNTEYILNVNPAAGRSRDDIIRQVQSDLREEMPGVDIEVEQPLAHMISHMLSGVSAQLAIKIHGDDLDMLGRTAEQVRAAIAGTAGLSPPVIEAQRQADELHIRLIPEQLAFYGVHRDYVADFVRAALRGEEVSQVVEGQRRFDLLVRLAEPYRSDYAQLGRLQLELPGGRGVVALSELISVEDDTGPNVVNRENNRRRIVIRCNAQGRDLASLKDEIEARVREHVRLPEGYSVEYAGQFESQRQATWHISLLALASIAGMFVVLLMLYPSTRIVLQILFALLMAFIGGVAALVITRQTLTVASMVGFISLGGIAARNGILLVSHYFHLMRHEGEGFTETMVLRGSLERLAPVLMTALTAGLGLLPLVVAGHQPGREVLYPVATVILGGLITSTLCEYLIHPGLFWRFSGSDARRLANAAMREDASL